MIDTLGLDHYEISLSPLMIARRCHQHGLSCYLLESKGKTTCFSMRIVDRKQVEILFPQAVLIYTSGVLGMLFRTLTKKRNVISYLIAAIVWFFLSSTVFSIDIIGEKDSLEQAMQQFLNSQLYQLKDIQEMKSSLLENFKEDVSWLEVYEKGSIIKVRYAAKEKIKKEKMNDKALIAKKDGMIVYFDCKQGNKVKKVHDVVHRGEVLVDNHMLDSQGKEVTVNVNGKVYAHTWKKVQVEVKKNHLPEAVNYFNMLLTARDQISIDKEWGEQIVSENILQFDPKQDTMKLEILYTLLEDITS